MSAYVEHYSKPQAQFTNNILTEQAYCRFHQYLTNMVYLLLSIHHWLISKLEMCTPICGVGIVMNTFISTREKFQVFV